jgi:hypothetical protein
VQYPETIIELSRQIELDMSGKKRVGLFAI